MLQRLREFAGAEGEHVGLVVLADPGRELARSDHEDLALVVGGDEEVVGDREHVEARAGVVGDEL